MEAAPKFKAITLRSGLSLNLHEVSFLDLQDGEEILKKPHSDWIAVDEEKKQTRIHESSKTIPVMVWLMSRKDGLTIDEVIARKWKFSLEWLTAQFTMKDLASHAETIVQCFFDPA